jgi:glycosyltransferase involved in cell wall biosynthesis
MTRFVAQTLASDGYQPVLAYYEPYSRTPGLSVPGFRLLTGKVGSERRSAFGCYEAHAIGAWLPELEFTHYLLTRPWRELMAGCTAFVCVSGNILSALPFALTGRPFLAWVATPWAEDRTERARGFPPLRRAVDRLINAPVLRRLERYVLTRGTVLALSEYTRARLDALADRPVVHGVLPQPVDTTLFRPAPDRVVPGRIGFVGRLDDARKNIPLFVETVRRCRARGLDVRGLLIGGHPEAVAAGDMAEYIEVVPYSAHQALPMYLQTLDAFVIPSHQEGLCIAALEAMACGAPVVSTRCGGPEEFVRDDETGYLVDHDAAALADAVARIVVDRARRDRMGDNSRALVEACYAYACAERVFRDAFEYSRSQKQERTAA